MEAGPAHRAPADAHLSVKCVGRAEATAAAAGGLLPALSFASLRPRSVVIQQPPSPLPPQLSVTPTVS